MNKRLFFFVMCNPIFLSQNDLVGTLKAEIVKQRQLAYALHIPKNNKREKNH
jgi:hypothetical protein